MLDYIELGTVLSKLVESSLRCATGHEPEMILKSVLMCMDTVYLPLSTRTITHEIDHDYENGRPVVSIDVLREHSRPLHL